MPPNKYLDYARHSFSLILTLGALALIFFAVAKGHAALPGECIFLYYESSIYYTDSQIHQNMKTDKANCFLRSGHPAVLYATFIAVLVLLGYLEGLQVGSSLSVVLSTFHEFLGNL